MPDIKPESSSVKKEEGQISNQENTSTDSSSSPQSNTQVSDNSTSLVQATSTMSVANSKKADVKVLKALVSTDYDGIKANFASWKSNIELFIAHQGIEDHFNPPANLKKDDSWLAEDRSIRACVIATIHTTLRMGLAQLTSTQAVWEHLCATNEPKDVARAGEIANLLYHFSITPTDNIEQRVLDMRHTFNEWKKAGGSATSSEFVEYLRHALPQDFNSI